MPVFPDRSKKSPTTALSEFTPKALYTAAQSRELDRIAIEDFGIPGIHLMKRAGRAVFELVQRRWAKQPLTVLCGSGNNGGDGYIVAGLAHSAGWPVDVLYLSQPQNLQGDALLAYQFARQTGVTIKPFQGKALQPGIVIDALLGTGLSGSVRENYSQAISCINASGNPVVCVDIPSGLSADTGMPLGAVTKADCTVTFIAMKLGLLTGCAADYCGDIVFAGLGVPDKVYEKLVPSACHLDLAELLCALPRRTRSSHKGQFGHVLVIGGDSGYGGAVIMAAEAALRVGAGLVSVATREEHVAPLLSRVPAVMARGVSSIHQLQPMLDQATVVVLGPGLGQTAWSEQMFQRAMSCGLPMVVDADALNLLARNKPDRPLSDHCVLTPHPGEAARLLNSTTAAVQQDRFAAVSTLQKQYGGNILLKGSGSIVCTHSGKVGISSYGNPGMASGGMGDVLSGVIGGLLAQKVPAHRALELGVCLHGKAADISAKDGERGTTATDLYSPLRALVNGISV